MPLSKCLCGVMSEADCQCDFYTDYEWPNIDEELEKEETLEDLWETDS